MVRKEIFEELKKGLCDLDDDKVAALVNECMKAGVLPLDVIVKGLAPALTIIGDEYARNDRFKIPKPNAIAAQ